MSKIKKDEDAKSRGSAQEFSEKLAAWWNDGAEKAMRKNEQLVASTKKISREAA